MMTPITEKAKRRMLVPSTKRAVLVVPVEVAERMERRVATLERQLKEARARAATCNTCHLMKRYYRESSA